MNHLNSIILSTLVSTFQSSCNALQNDEKRQPITGNSEQRTAANKQFGFSFEFVEKNKKFNLRQ